MAEVRLEHIQKKFDKALILDDLDLTVADGEFMVLVGPSGCGKSTTLRLIAGLETITSGTISIGSHIVNSVPAKDRDIAMVFQNYALYPHLDVYSNLAFGLKFRKIRKSEIERRVRETAETLDIQDLLQRKPRELSGGQRQRVALGRAIVRQPKVFLFDEPLSNLDAKLRGQMRTEINRLHKQLQTTIIYVTHDQTEAMTMGDRITILDQGRIQQIGTPLELYKKPANVFVAGFIGSPPMNLFPVTINTDSDRIVIRGRGFHFSFPHNKGNGNMTGFQNDQAILGIRSEDLKIRESGQSQPDYLQSDWPALVDVCENMGSEQLIYGRMVDTEEGFIVRVSPDFQATHGDRLNLFPDSARLHFFDRQS